MDRKRKLSAFSVKDKVKIIEYDEVIPADSMPIITMKNALKSLKNVHLYFERCEDIPPSVFHTLYNLENMITAQGTVSQTKITDFFKK